MNALQIFCHMTIFCFKSKQHSGQGQGQKEKKMKWSNTEIQRDFKSKQERVFETPFQWTIIRNVSSKKRLTIYSESAELVTPFDWCHRKSSQVNLR